MSAEPVDLHVFVRPPLRGRVKTRLQADIGASRALAAYREMLLLTLNTAAAAHLNVVVWSAERPWHPTLRRWCAERQLRLRTQAPGDLGRRMRCALFSSLRAGRPALVIGSDCPSLDATALTAAADKLTHVDAVIGPATDGGYYLLGIRRSVPALFRNMRWSQPDVLRQTCLRARRAGVSLSLLAPLDDVDTGADFRNLMSETIGN